MNCEGVSRRSEDDPRYSDYSSSGAGESGAGWCGGAVPGEEFYNENYLPGDRHISGVSTESQNCHSYYEFHPHSVHHSHHSHHHHHNPAPQELNSPPIQPISQQSHVSNFPKKRTPPHEIYTIAIATDASGANNNNNFEPKSPQNATSPWSYHSFYQKNPSSPGNTSIGSSPPPPSSASSQLAPQTALQGVVNNCGIVSPKPGKPSFKRRTTANKKERRRTQSINNAFADLRDCIPNVPADTKLSKIKTLRLATSYIAYLSEVLSGDDPLRTPQAFTAEISKKMGRGDEKRRKELLMQELAGAGIKRQEVDNRKSKGRTGWPQHVWALELQQ